MRKPFIIACQLLAVGIMLLGQAPAQQTPAASAQPSQPASSQASSNQSAPATKSTSTTAKKAPVTPRSTTALALKTQKDKASYALGMKIGSDLRKQGVNASVDPAVAARGFKDALAGTKSQLTDDELRAALTQLQSQVREKQMAKAHEEGGAAHKAGEEFLAANKDKEGVVTLPSGMQYKILTAGSGPKPTASDTVSCNYKGTLLNGKEFDSSYKRGHPETFPVGGVIKGWTEALQLMPVGSKWQFFVPSDLGHGVRGAGADIASNTTLIFEVELLSIQPKAADKTDQKPDAKPEVKQ